MELFREQFNQVARAIAELARRVRRLETLANFAPITQTVEGAVEEGPGIDIPPGTVRVGVGEDSILLISDTQQPAAEYGFGPTGLSQALSAAGVGDQVRIQGVGTIDGSHVVPTGVELISTSPYSVEITGLITLSGDGSSIKNIHVSGGVLATNTSGNSYIDNCLCVGSDGVEMNGAGGTLWIYNSYAEGTSGVGVKQTAGAMYVTEDGDYRGTAGEFSGTVQLFSLDDVIRLKTPGGFTKLFNADGTGILAAIAAASDGDEIDLPLGIYVADLNVTKKLTINGPRGYGFGSGPFSQIVGNHTFNTANLTFSNITITDATAGSVTVTVNGGSVVFDRCYVENTGTGAAKALVLNNDAKVSSFQSQFTSATSTSGQAIEINGTAIFLGFAGGAGGYTSGGAIEVNGGVLRLTSFGIANTNVSGYHISNIGGVAHICGVYGYDASTSQMVDLRTSGTVVDFCGGSGGSGSIESSRLIAAYNHYDGITYDIGLASGADERSLAVDTEPAVDVGTAGQWDETHVKDPWIIDVDGVLYMYYAGESGSVFQIGLARSYDSGQTWEKYASNPVLTPTQAWENFTVNEVHTPCVLYDRDETDANKRFKMWYSGGEFGQGGAGYAYSADGITWTKYASNPVVTKGTAGQWDDSAIGVRGVVRLDDVYYLFYNGWDGVGTWKGGLVTFTDPEGTYTKSSDNPILEGDGKTTTIASNVSVGNTVVNVADSTIFPIGAPVWVYDNTNRYLSTIVDRPSSTQITLDDAAPAAVGSATGNVRSAAYNSLVFGSVLYDGGWRFTLTAFQVGLPSGLQELSMLAYSYDLDEVIIDYAAGLIIPITLAESQGGSISRENPSLLDTWRTSDRFLDDDKNIEVKDEGTTQGYVQILDFTGNGVAASVSAGVATVNIPGGAGGGSSAVFVPVTDGDVATPEIIFNNGEVVMNGEYH